MITLTNAGYVTLIALSVLGGYILHGVIDAIKDGTFFDWNKKSRFVMNRLARRYKSKLKKFWIEFILSIPQEISNGKKRNRSSY